MPTYQKFALILASNYPGTTFQLGGCIVDAERMRNFLVTQRGFPASNITTIYNMSMTKAGILKAFDDMVARSKSIAATGDIPAFFLHYSGHGTRVWNSNKRSLETFTGRQALPPDGFNDSDGDEALVPQDVRSKGLLLDDEINDRLVKRLHPSTQLFALTDCCNSGSNLDLSYQGLSKVTSIGDQTPSIIHVAGSRDSQLSAEIASGGVATTRLLQVLTKSPKTVPELQNQMGDLSSAYNAQHPQVSVSKSSLVQGTLFPWIVSNLPANTVVKRPIATPEIVLDPKVPAVISTSTPIPIRAQRPIMTITLSLDLLKNFLPLK